jgi:excisionase family DNA binding protein
METLFSVEEAARRLGGISPWTIRYWLSSGRLIRTKIGRRTMISESDLMRFIQDGNKPTGRREVGDQGSRTKPIAQKRRQASRDEK